MKNNQNQGEIVLYQPDNEIRLEVRLQNETVWLTQAQIADLFGTKRPAITKHLKNIFETKELVENSVCSILELTAADGKNYATKFYNLDAIISVGYRVNSRNATLFRQWANTILKEYLLQGHSINSRIERLEERVLQTEEKVDFFVRTSLPPTYGVFFENQIFDAYSLVAKLIKSAKHSIILIDNYIDESVLTLLDKREPSVSAIIYTKHINNQLTLDLQRHNQQYPPILIEPFNKAHDRFLLIDDCVYHIGASVKDIGKKWSAITFLSDITASEIQNKLK